MSKSAIGNFGSRLSELEKSLRDAKISLSQSEEVGRDFDYDSDSSVIVTTASKEEKKESVEKIKAELPRIYDEILNLIYELLCLIKKDFSNRVESCDLFTNIDYAEGRKNLKKFFPKLFVDREAFNPDKGYDQFNQSSESGNDLVYAEGFALAFAEMLIESYQFLSDKKNPSEIEDFFLISLIKKFSNSAIVFDEALIELDDENNIKSCGSYIEYGDLKKLLDIEKFEPVALFYDFKGASQHIFYDKFDHEKCFKYYFEREFLPRYKSDNKNDKVKAIADLLSFIDHGVHINFDGNGRAGILVSWFLSIINDQNHCCGINPYLLTERLRDEAQVWAKRIFEDPETPAMLPKCQELQEKSSQEIFKEEKRRIKKDAQEQEFAGVFLQKIFRDYFGARKVLFEIPLNLAKTNYVDLSEFFSIKKESIFVFPQDGNFKKFDRREIPSKNILPFDFSFLNRIVEINQEDLAGQNIDQRNKIIALAFIKAARNFKEKLMGEGFSDSFSNTLDVVICVYYDLLVGKDDNQELNLEQKFVAEYLKENPQRAENIQKRYNAMTGVYQAEEEEKENKEESDEEANCQQPPDRKLQVTQVSGINNTGCCTIL